MKKIVFLSVLILVVIIWVNHLKAQVAYVDMNCPTCGSDEVLDFGETDNGQHCHCYDCGQEFYIEEHP